MTRISKWIAVAGCVVVLVAAAGRMRPSLADDPTPPRERPVTEGDAASRLDRIIEKLDRVVDRMEAERRGPPDRPPHRMPPGPGGPREHREHAEHSERGEYRRPGDHDGPPGPRHREPGMWGEGRRGPRAEMPPEMREMFQKRMEEAQRRMEQAREKFKELEERVKKLEAEVERLKSA
ncbi:MAG: hypothetical protein RLZZ111_1737 [Planctomycetota bacterium]|jgi:hypothetical protein